MAPVLAVGRARYFYPRSPCGERLSTLHHIFKLFPISIHALLAESDRTPTTVLTLICISIHALLAESDISQLQCILGRRYFYPRSPCGERLVNALELANLMLFLSTLSLRRATAPQPPQGESSIKFLSTLSLRRATVGVFSCYLDNIISIHALLAESDAQLL